MAELPAEQVAQFMIAFSHEHGDPISNLKLQKLLYYAQAWFLALKDRPLFDERIEAWAHGPVVPPVYGQFKKWTWQPIDNDARVPELAAPIREHLEEVMDVYGDMSANQLEKLTHSEDPWRIARGNLPADAASNAVIPLDAMKTFYRARANGGN